MNYRESLINKGINFYKKHNRFPTRSELHDLKISNGVMYRHFGNQTKYNSIIKSYCPDVVVEKEHSTKDKIVDLYIAYIIGFKRIPTSVQLSSMGTSVDTIKHHFGNMTKLHEYMNENYNNVIKENIITEQDIFNEDNKNKTKENIKNYQRFFITTYVNDKKVDKNFLRSIQNFCDRNNAKLLIIPCSDVSSTRTVNTWNFDPVLKNESFVFTDTKLNNSLYINTIKISAKQINPITGLARLGQRNGSYIYASPKQFLEYVVNSSKPDKMPHAVMTTGAISKSDYNSEKYMSNRTAHIADYDHVIGGIIVEIVDDKIFHFRQVQADKNGSFIDLSNQYYPDGSVEAVEAHLVLGDWHTGQTEETVRNLVPEMLNNLRITDVFLHDFFDGTAVNHHIANAPLKLAERVKNNKTSLSKELYECAKELKWFQEIFDGTIHIVKGNHDEFLSRYLENGTYVKDPENHYISLSLAKALLDGYDPLKVGIEDNTKYFENYDNSRIIWHDRDTSYSFGGFELAAHGDLGNNGAFSSPIGLEKAYGSCIVGHVHTPLRFRGVVRVGTSTLLRLPYVRGPSSWVHSHVIVYANATSQNINIIGGNYKLNGS